MSDMERNIPTNETNGTDTAKHSNGVRGESKAHAEAYRFTEISPPTILQVIPELEAGGAERTAVDVSVAVVEAGGRALIVTAGGRLSMEAAAAGAEIIHLPVQSKNPVTILANVVRLQRVIRDEGVQLVHARSRAPAWSALLAARRAGVPFVTTYHGTYNAGSALKRMYNSIMARGDRVIANSHFIADRIRTEHAIPAERIVVIPRGIDVQAFDPAAVAPERLEALRSAWGLTGVSAPIVLLPGRLTRWKGQLVLLEALRKLRDMDREVVCVLVGDAQGRDSYKTEIDHFVSDHGLDQWVRVPGHCTDVPAACGLADVVVSASTDPEAFGRVAVEAQAMGKPVIASDHGAARETLITKEDVGVDGATGWRVPPGDADALAEALVEILDSDPRTLAVMGECARAHVCADYAVAVMCARTLDVYEKMLSV